jgi:hypothetical protein
MIEYNINFVQVFTFIFFCLCMFVNFFVVFKFEISKL